MPGVHSDVLGHRFTITISSPRRHFNLSNSRKRNCSSSASGLCPSGDSSVHGALGLRCLPRRLHKLAGAKRRGCLRRPHHVRHASAYCIPFPLESSFTQLNYRCRCRLCMAFLKKSFCRRREIFGSKRIQVNEQNSFSVDRL